MNPNDVLVYVNDAVLDDKGLNIQQVSEPRLIPTPYTEIVLPQFHDEPLIGHIGNNTTTEKLL